MGKGGEEVMTVVEESQGKVAAASKFPAGMRVLAVDDDPVCLKLLECLLRHCNYRPTTVAHAEAALEMLREREEQFDLVISDVHMPGMDGFKLLEHIGLEMDLPVIMLSANGEAETVMKGITHGACDYLVKPVRVKELKNIWQHVVRRKPEIRNHISGDNDNDNADQEVQSGNVEGEKSGENCSMKHAGNDNADQEMQSGNDEGEQSGENSTKKHSSNEGNDDADQEVQSGNDEGEQSGENSTRKHSRNEGNDVDDSDRNKENAGVSARKKTRITWTCPLHRKFVEVVNQIGVDRAVPKKILDMMNVEYITRENVASHLQKYRLYLKRIGDCTSRSPDLLAHSCERWNSVFSNTKELDIFDNYHRHGRHLPPQTVASSNSSNLFARMNFPSALAAHSLLTTQSTQLSYDQSKLGMGTVGHGGSLLKNAVPESLEDLLNGESLNARNCFSSGNSFTKSSNGRPSDARKDFPSSLSGKSFANRPDVMLLDSSESFPSNHSSKDYASILRGKLLEASRGIPSSLSDDSFEDISNGGTLEPANQFPVHPPELGKYPLVQMNSSSTDLFSTFAGNASGFPDPGNFENSRQIVVPSKFPDLHKNIASLGPLQANIPKNNQLTRFDASSGQIPMFGNELQNQMAAIMSNTSAMAGFNEQMAPFNLGSNTNSTEMQNNNFALGSASNISSAIPNLQMGSSAMPDQMLNGGGVGGIPPMHGGTVDQQAVDDQLIYSNGTNGLNGSDDLDDIFADYLNQDFTEDDDAFIMDGDWELVP